MGDQEGPGHQPKVWYLLSNFLKYFADLCCTSTFQTLLEHIYLNLFCLALGPDSISCQGVSAWWVKWLSCTHTHIHTHTHIYIYTWGDLLCSAFSLLFLLLDLMSKNAQGHYQFVLGPHRGTLFMPSVQKRTTCGKASSVDVIWVLVGSRHAGPSTFPNLNK